VMWCAGSNVLKQTMERYNTLLPGTDTTVWGTALGGFVLNGTNADGLPIKGTPKKRNSITYLVTNSGFANGDKTLTKENSPYLITHSGLTVPEGVTLTLESGTVIKLVSHNEPSFTVHGTLISEGTEEDPVVITSYRDDEYGGDMNGDGVCDPGNASSTALCPAPGSWKQMHFTSSSENSSLLHTIIRYGGRWFNGDSFKTMVLVEETDVTFDYSTFEHSYRDGLNMKNSTSTISNSEFKNNNNDAYSIGLFISGGAPVVTENIFKDNYHGLSLQSSKASVSSNIFTDNAGKAIESSGAIGALSGNEGSGNGVNAITLSGSLTEGEIGTTTLAYNSLPYLLRGESSVVSSTTLAFEDGVVVKGHDAAGGFSNKGRLVVKKDATLFHGGATSSSLIFTSKHDNAVGGAIGSPLTTPSVGEWWGIVVKDGGIVNLGGFSVKYADTGLSLTNATAALQSTHFESNTLDIKSVGSTTIFCTDCTGLVTSPADLFE
jgi:hypothetical protein